MLKQRHILLVVIYGWMVALLGYMELQNEVERIGPRNALVTDHFTGEVRNCYTYSGGDWACHPVDIDPRSWVFALIPFWPARDDIGQKLHLSRTWADDTPFTQTAFCSDLIPNRLIGIVMLVVGIFIIRTKDDAETDNTDGGGTRLR